MEANECGSVISQIEPQDQGVMDEYEMSNNETLISNPWNTEELSQLTCTLYETNSLFHTMYYMYYTMLCLNLSSFVLLYHAMSNYTMPLR